MTTDYGLSLLPVSTSLPLNHIPYICQEIEMASSKNGFETKLLKAKDFKEQGTKLLNEGNFKAANGKYHQVLDSLGGKEIGPHETERKDLIQVNFCQPLIFVI